MVTVVVMSVALIISSLLFALDFPKCYGADFFDFFGFCYFLFWALLLIWVFGRIK